MRIGAERVGYLGKGLRRTMRCALVLFRTCWVTLTQFCVNDIKMDLGLLGNGGFCTNSLS